MLSSLVSNNFSAASRDTRNIVIFLIDVSVTFTSDAYLIYDRFLLDVRFPISCPRDELSRAIKHAQFFSRAIYQRLELASLKVYNRVYIRIPLLVVKSNAPNDLYLRRHIGGGFIAVLAAVLTDAKKINFAALC